MVDVKGEMRVRRSNGSDWLEALKIVGFKISFGLKMILKGA